MTKVIEVSQLKFKYKDSKRLILDDLNLSVAENEILGLVGPNGAGKSTFISILEGLQTNYTGQVLLFGIDLKKDAKSAQKQIGALFQASGYFDNLTVKEALSMFAQMYQKALSPKEALAYMDASELLDQKVKNLSGGQKQKFGIALSLINQPKLLFLDEPTTGLDPDARLQLWKTIKKLQGKTTIVICSHYLDEVAYLCDRVCFIYQGNVYATDTPEGLIKKSQAQTKIEFECLDPATLIEKSNGLLKKADLQSSNPGRYLILTNEPDPILALLYELKTSVSAIDVKRPTLDDAYYKITGKSMEGLR